MAGVIIKKNTEGMVITNLLRYFFFFSPDSSNEIIELIITQKIFLRRMKRNRSKRHVFKVADWGGNDIEGSHF